MDEDPLCIKCKSDEETPYHVICLCPSFGFLRYITFGKFLLNIEDVQKMKFDDIMGFLVKSGRSNDLM